MESESLPDEEPYPIVFEDMPWFTCELTGLSRISFSVADDPFYKSSKAKYYPEVYLIGGRDSEIKAAITPNKRKSEKYPSAFEYCEDFREPALRVNDDRKIRINLSDLLNRKRKDGSHDHLHQEKPRNQKMIILAVKCFDVSKRMPVRPGEFDRAWYRINNEDTNQTIDYKKIKEIEKPEGFDEDAVP